MQCIRRIRRWLCAFRRRRRFFLKDYDLAIADGNPILAVVANSAINTDGRKSGLTVPNPKTQAALLEQAYVQAGINPADIDYLEAHGTGTIVGDPIESQAIGHALGKSRPKNSPLLIGSVKSNLGHLEAASGVAGLVKALYCIQHRVVPATIGIKNPDPNIQFDNWNIKVVTENRQLKKTGKLIIGVNSFGFGGANAHVILESHERQKTKVPRHLKTPLLPIVLLRKRQCRAKSGSPPVYPHFWMSKLNPNFMTSPITQYLGANGMNTEQYSGATTKVIAKELLNFADNIPATSG